MRKLYLSIGALLGITSIAGAQYSENFDSYTAGSFIGVVSANWTTWSGTTGGAEDAKIDTVQANSGSNSIYFNGNTAGGGPQDVVLPFGGQYNIGQFNYSHAMYIPSGKGSYFNFQAESTIGNTWALDCYFSSDGNYYLSNSGTIVLTGSYPSDQWFTLTFDIDLNTNNWEFLLDGSSEGSWANTENQIASIDIFPLNPTSVNGNNQSTFWIDDVSYTYTPYTLTARNAAVLNTSFAGPVFVGKSLTPTVEVKNLGTTAITSFDLVVDYNGTQITQSFSGLNITSLDTYTAEFSNDITIATATNVTATVSNVNGSGADLDPADDSKTIAINPVVPAADKMVVIEEATGSWCGWCPRGTVAMNYLAHDYEDFAIGIAVHNNDPMEVNAYDAGIGNFISGYPSALVDRDAVVDPSDIFGPISTEIVTAPAARLKNGATYDAATGLLKVSVTATNLSTLNAGYKLGCVLTEDGVTGATNGYAQANYYSTSSQNRDLFDLDGSNWRNKPNPVPASSMVYDHVARAIAPDFNGYENSFTGAMAVGDSATVNFFFIVDQNWDTANMHIVGLLYAPDGSIDNGVSTSIAKAISNGLVSGPNVGEQEYLRGPDDIVKLYPNPASGYFNVYTSFEQESAIEVINMNGEVVFSKIYQHNSGNEAIKINTEDFATGLYMVKVSGDNKTVTKKLVIK